MQIASSPPLRAWLVGCAKYAAVRLAQVVVAAMEAAVTLHPMTRPGANIDAAEPSPKAYRESPADIAADARAASDSAEARSEAEDLTDQGPGATDRIRAARINAINLDDAATEAEDDADPAAKAEAESDAGAYASEPSSYE